MRALLGKRRPLLALGGTVTLRLVLANHVSAAAPSGFVVREIARDQLTDALATGGFQESAVAELDDIAPLGWRCFGVFIEGGRLVHHSFVAKRADGPEIFRVLTVFTHRRMGMFRAAVDAIGSALRTEGHDTLGSKAGVTNQVSVRAHRQVGFAIVNRRYELTVLGVNLMLAASKLRRRLRGGFP